MALLSMEPLQPIYLSWDFFSAGIASHLALRLNWHCVSTGIASQLALRLSWHCFYLH